MIKQKFKSLFDKWILVRWITYIILLHTVVYGIYWIITCSAAFITWSIDPFLNFAISGQTFRALLLVLTTISFFGSLRYTTIEFEK